MAGASPERQWTIDRLGRVVRVQGLRCDRKLDYQEGNHFAGFHDSDGKSTRQETSENLVTAVIDGLGHITRYDYNAREEVTKIVDALGNGSRNLLCIDSPRRKPDQAMRPVIGSAAGALAFTRGMTVPSMASTEQAHGTSILA